MICSYCNQEMTAGHVEKERYALKWIPEENSRGRFLDWLPWSKGIKLMEKGWTTSFKHSIIDSETLFQELASLTDISQ